MQRTFREKKQDLRPKLDDFAGQFGELFDHGAELSWDQVLETPRVLLVAEAGAGKSYECERQATWMFERGDAAFYLRLENLLINGLDGVLRRKQRQRFVAWLASASKTGYFFLDSIDELQLVHGSFRAALQRLSDDLEGALGRAVIVITSRPVPIDRRAIREILPVPEKQATIPAGQEFVQIAMRSAEANAETATPETLRELTLLPLGDRQLVELAQEHGVEDAEELLQQIHARNANDFARWPQELIELCDDWREHGEIRSHADQVESHVRASLNARADRKEKADLSVDKARRGAQRLALAVMLCRRWTFRYNAEAESPGSGEPFIDPVVLLEEWSAPEIRALLERPLFGDGGYGRVRFRHRSVLEYLAACQIHSQIESGELNLSAAMRMLLGMTAANEKVTKPSLRPVAAWLALLRKDVFDAVLKVDPGTLLIHGDPESLHITQCQRALGGFVRIFELGQRRGLEVPSVQVSRLARQPLGACVMSLWNDSIENPEIRILLLKLVAEGKYQCCADLAASVAADADADSYERFQALVALSNLSDDRSSEYIESAMTVAQGWPQAIGRWLGTSKYPEIVTEAQLISLLRRTTHEPKRYPDYASSVARVIEASELDVSRLKVLLPELVKLSRALLELQNDEVVEPPGRLKVSLILRAVVIRLLSNDIGTDDVLHAAVMAFRCAKVQHVDRHGSDPLSKLIAELPIEGRKRFFELDYAWVSEWYPHLSSRAILVRLALHGNALTYSLKQDWDWILEALADVVSAEAYRIVLLHLALRLAPTKAGKVVGRKAVKCAVKDSSALVGLLEDAVAAIARPDRELVKMAEAQRKREAQQKRKAAREEKEWTRIWSELAKRPAAALSKDRCASTIWNVALALRNKRDNHGEARWDRAFLERSFGQIATDGLRLALMDDWRARRPTVHREREEGKKNTYPLVWSNALMGLYAEAEDPLWAKKLSAAEADLAVRYALLELNGFPSWMVALGNAHPRAVEHVIGEEIVDALSAPAGVENTTAILLQSVRLGHRSTGQLLERRLVQWLSNSRSMMRARHTASAESRLDDVIRVLLAHGSYATKKWLSQLAIREGAAAEDGPFRYFWLEVLCQADCHRGLVSLLAMLGKLPVRKDGEAVGMIGRLFDDRNNSGGNWRAGLSPNEMLQLVKEIHRHVRASDDIVHEGVYSPSSRDKAEDGRRYVFNELLAATGSEAVEAKLAMAADPAFAHLRDHITMVARDRLATDIDASVFSPHEVAQTLRGRELAPKTGTDMAHLLLDRLDDLQDLMLQDTAPREAWAWVKEENALRPAIAREFQVAAHGSYTVDQEAVTVDGKETDIRLRAVSGHEATIELKLGEKSRSGAVLRDTVQTQLVAKYMQYSKARTGCLIVTVSDPTKRWKHPSTGKPMDRFQLQDMLEEAAQEAQQKLGGDARVLARILDLTPQLPTEAQAATQTKAGRKRRRTAQAA
ncbi:hypothetical protein [Variovorax paradoxus]|uniref:hypothetical protein n=1 Tax=Variovorax paradoxus TaxID=34073 RepID=UPI00285C92E7|nr:hypothetical protein [Variovorax paradoxus]MDR6453447.1 hypothetical protein [Variovorax paradoxus]